MKRQHNQGGYITLFATVVAGAIGVSIATSLLMRGLMLETQSAVGFHEAEAIHLVHSCIEKALYRIKDNPSFVGQEILAFGGGHCTLTVITEGTVPHIYASSTVQGVVKKAEVWLISGNPPIVDRWEEVGELSE